MRAAGFIRTLTAATVGVVLSQTAQTDVRAEEGFYLDAGFGIGILPDLQSDVAIGTPGATGNMTFNSGITVKVAAGVEFIENVRGEIEVAQRRNETGNLFAPSNVLGGGALDSAGSVGVTTVMLNGLYAIPVPDSSVTVVLGAGVGWARKDINLERGATNPGFILSRGVDNALAYQLKAGIETPFFEDVRFYLDYVFLGTAANEFSGFNSTAGSVQQNLDYFNHSFIAGVRRNF